MSFLVALCEQPTLVGKLNESRTETGVLGSIFPALAWELGLL